MKKWIFPLTLLIIIGGIFLVLKKEEVIQEQPSAEKNSLPEELVQDRKVNELLEKIFTSSQKGQIPNTPFIAGETPIKDVIDTWRKPQTIDYTSVGTFANYPDQYTSIGYELSQVFDIRSFHPALQDIHLEDITNYAGEPDDIKYYEDSTTKQQIIIYYVNSTFHLKWVLVKSNDTDQNPKVHHISVVTKSNDELTKEIALLSLEEKIGQMIFAGISGKTLNDNDQQLIQHYKIGGIIFFNKNLQSPQQITTLLNKVKEVNETNQFPLFLGIDQEGGRVARLPSSVKNLPTSAEIGEKENDRYAYEIGQLLGRELNTFGFNLNFAPVLDVNSNPSNPVIGDRSFSSNAKLVSRLGIQTMQGMQAQNIISVIKHFPGHGDTGVDSHLELPIVNKTIEQLQELELIPFQHAINNGADVVMIAHILLPKIDSSAPSTMSELIVTNLLREQLAFDGVVITDDMTMEAITENYDIGLAAVQSIKAGSDIILIAHQFENAHHAINTIKKAVENGDISEQRINESVRRIIKLKEKYKLDNSPTSDVDIQELNYAIEEVLSKYN